ncbi:MAG: hypothetical protein WCY22_03105 [Acholeplasmataceae bacterium]
MENKQSKKKKKIINFKEIGQNLFAKFFGFEQGIDITDDVAVLYRRNVVIKNIIFVSNIMFSFLQFLLSLATGEVTDWVITVATFPLVYVINKLLKSLINMDHHDRTKQSVAMYVAAFYIFFASILMYARLYEQFETGAYILMYYAVVVISLYQEKKLLSRSFQGLLALLTVIHLLLTYNLESLSQNMTIIEFIPVFVRHQAFRDILLRSVLFTLFYFVVYATVSMGQYMQEERRKELAKRRQVQSDFTNVVGNLFSDVLAVSSNLIERKHAFHVQEMSKRIASYMALSDEKIAEIEAFAVVHLQYPEIKNILGNMSISSETDYDILKQKMLLGSKITKRMQLARKCEDIARAHAEGNQTEAFINDMNQIQPELESQIILMADLYISLRKALSYKRPYTHQAVYKHFQTELNQFFESDLKERFMRFHEELSEIYSSF